MRRIITFSSSLSRSLSQAILILRGRLRLAYFHIHNISVYNNIKDVKMSHCSCTISSLHKSNLICLNCFYERHKAHLPSWFSFSRVFFVFVFLTVRCINKSFSFLRCLISFHSSFKSTRLVINSLGC